MLVSENVKICVTPDAKPKICVTPNASHWNIGVHNAKFRVGHVHLNLLGVDFICVGSHFS